jgi:hypothetical protein
MAKVRMGRPTLYTKELASEICELVACESKGLKTLCKQNSHWPDRVNIYRWMKKYPDFRIAYAQAKEFQIEALVDEILDIGDDASKDDLIRVNKNGEEIKTCNNEWVQRSRLKCDNRKWLAAKLCPRLYGDKFIDKDSAESLISKVIDKL